MAKLTITFDTARFEDGLTWANVLDTLGAIHHFMKRDCVEEGSVYKPITGKWSAPIFAHEDDASSPRHEVASWVLDPELPA